MSDSWCDDCSWPYECMAANACRRAEMGERRIAAPAETAAAIAAELPEFELISEGGPAAMGRRVIAVKPRVLADHSFNTGPVISEAIITGHGQLSDRAMAALYAWSRKL